MVKCAALNCTNYWGKRSMPRTIKFHRFPKDPELRKQWMKICGNRADVNPAQDGICSDHFEDSDYRLKDLLLNIPMKKRHLKEDAVPTVVVEKISGKKKPKKGLEEPLEDPLSLHERSIDECLPKSAENPESKWILTELLVEPIFYRECSTKKEGEQNGLLEAPQKALTEKLEINETSETSESKTIKIKGAPGISESSTQTGHPKKQDKAVQTEMEYEVGLEFRIMYAEAEARKLKATLKRAVKKRRREETKEETLKKIFTPGQLRRIREPDKKFSWSDEDQIAAQELYSAGIRSYNILRDRGFPLPGASLHRQWASKAKAKLKPDPETEIVPALEPAPTTEGVAAPEPVSKPKPRSRLKLVSGSKPVSRTKSVSKSALDTELVVALETILPPESELAPKPIKERDIQIYWSEFMSAIE